MLEIGASGSVGGEGGNILVCPATYTAMPRGRVINGGWQPSRDSAGRANGEVRVRFSEGLEPDIPRMCSARADMAYSGKPDERRAS